MKEDTVLVQKVGGLVQLIHLLSVAMITEESSGVGREGGKDGGRGKEGDREREGERESSHSIVYKHIHVSPESHIYQ
jgi:hypothetical protein